MTRLDCENCGGLGWVHGTDMATKCNCDVCNPALPKPPRRKPQRNLRKQSEKTKAVRHEMKPLRTLWLEAIGTCECCGKAKAEHVHEIPAGSSRQRAFVDPRCWIGLCAECHRLTQSEPFDAQLGIVVEATARAINHALGREAV